MPIIASPLPRGYFPKHRESSAQRSLRDSDATGKMWLKSQQTNQQTQQMQNALSSTNRAVQKLQRRILGMAPPLANNVQIVQPFQIYNIANTSGGKDVLTFQIRDGIVSARSKYWKNGYANKAGAQNPPLFNGSFEIIPLWSNSEINEQSQASEIPLLVAQDGQSTYGYVDFPNGAPDSTVNTFSSSPIANSGTPVTLAETTDTLISGFDSSGNAVNYSQIIAADMTGKSGQTVVGFAASFFIEIVDDKTKGFYANLWGRMVTLGGVGNIPVLQNAPFPEGSQYIPIGVVGFGVSVNDDGTAQTITGYNGQYTFTQYLTGNLTARYPANTTQYRGRWTADTLSSQVFYPGDLVIDDSVFLSKALNTGIGSFQYYGEYIYVGLTPDFATTNPGSDATNWKKVGMVI